MGYYMGDYYAGMGGGTGIGRFFTRVAPKSPDEPLQRSRSAACLEARARVLAHLAQTGRLLSAEKTQGPSVHQGPEKVEVRCPMCGTTVCDCGLCHECEIDWEEEEEDDDEERGNCDNDSEEVSPSDRPS